MFKPPTNMMRNRDRGRTLYFLRCGDYLKIGITHNLIERVAQFKAGNPYPIILEAYRTIPASMARQIEGAIHAELAHAKHEGEWFSISKQEAVKVAHKIIGRAIKAEKAFLDQYEIRAWSVQDNNSDEQVSDKLDELALVSALGKG